MYVGTHTIMRWAWPGPRRDEASSSARVYGHVTASEPRTSGG
jgi:hypothetical protein